MISTALSNPDQLQLAATNQTDNGIRLELQFIHSEVMDAIAAFAKDPSAATLRKLNGHWAHGSNVLKVATAKKRARK